MNTASTLLRLRHLWLVVALALAGGAIFSTAQPRVEALPAAGSDIIAVTAGVDVSSRLGTEHVILTGWAQIAREAPHMEGGDEVVDFEVTALDMRGASVVGLISVRESAALSSIGELRSGHPSGDFPATADFDLFLDVTVPATPVGILVVHNDEALHLTPVGSTVDAWPPLGSTFELDPVYNFDNDGDTQIDEDSSDEDGDGLFDEDRPGADPPAPGTECGIDPDCDGQEGEDPPFELCAENSGGAGTPCDDDGDTLVDEDPDCIPLFDEGGFSFKAGLCVRDLSLDIAPELPSFSAARGGPSGLHPADILALTPAEAITDPAPVAVSGNDDFADAYPVPGAPFIGTQSTIGSTTELEQTGWINPTSEEAVVAAGDGDGYETAAEEAMADGGGFASDENSGTDTTSVCTDADPQGKDRHIFRDFNFDTNSFDQIRGIELRLDAWADSSAGSPAICAQLSGDGGALWSFFTRISLPLSSTEQTYVLGSPSDVWRIFPSFWSADEFTNENFRVRLTDRATEPDRDFNLDNVAVRLYTDVEPLRCATSDFAGTVWYTFTAPSTGSLTIDTLGSDFDTVLSVYTGDDVYDLTLVSCDDDITEGGPSRVIFTATAGTTYRIQAGGWLGATGNLQLNVQGVSSQAPFVRLSCLSLGLTADGCDDGTDGDQDDIDALSYGADLPAGADIGVNFSVGPGGQGVPGSAVRGQYDCPPSSPGLSPEADGDEFGSLLDGGNTHVLDGNGPVGACSPAFPIGFVEAATVRDNLDALDGRGPEAVDANRDGTPEGNVYFSLDAASPSLAALGRTAGDILMTSGGAAPQLFAARADLGLVADDDVDAICLRESGDGAFGAGDELYFSLAPGSPTLATIGATPGALLAPGDPPAGAISPLNLGLIGSDDLDAAKCQSLTEAPPEPNGDVNCDGQSNAIDAALVLQLGAGLVGSLSCGENADVNQDGMDNAIDAALILQFVAGLIDRLPYP